MDIFRGGVGILFIVGLAFVFSNNKKAINWRLVGTGLLIQFILAVFILKGSVLESYFFPLGWPSIFFKWISSFFVVV
ncbi:MAG: NupC/NupG family nucleoside CNT transporter, partial [Bacteroidetes bacterium]|nr:NupC/NupG family nucleoside CNT transporter [Bacteroidota bacterium]